MIRLGRIAYVNMAPVFYRVDAEYEELAGVPTDLNENLVREIGLAAGLVDVKVCAVTEVWSGLKFVRRLKDR